MGNSATKEHRACVPDHTSPSHARDPRNSSFAPLTGPPANSQRRRDSDGHQRADLLTALGIHNAAAVARAETAVEPRRETKQERDARRLEKDRASRLKERQRSMKCEHVDGGFLVTHGVYTGMEDFCKPIVRYLMIERRLAPFWRGLNEHQEAWTENQLVLAARGLPVPAADAVPSPVPDVNPETATGRESEIALPHDPYVNEQRLEARLYKDVDECSICYLYYPPYLNKTRCCDQSVCSECFVQIKRPDPHRPESADNAEEEAEFISEPAACPFCRLPEFGITYEPPPFRRGLVHASCGEGTQNPEGPRERSNRQRAISLSADSASVITTDQVRPDWETKLISAQNHYARRSAAATALHTAAYLVNNRSHELDHRAFGMLSRRGFFRRPQGSEAPANSDTVDGRSRVRVDDLEEMMLLEAMRLSMASEEERQRREDKDARRLARRQDKENRRQPSSDTVEAGPSLSSSGGPLTSGPTQTRDM